VIECYFNNNTYLTKNIFHFIYIKVDLFSQEVILIPINKDKHWTLVIVDVPKKSISYYDSLSLATRTDIFTVILAYLKDEMKAKLSQDLVQSDWTFLTPFVSRILFASRQITYTLTYTFMFFSHRGNWTVLIVVPLSFRTQTSYLLETLLLLLKRTFHRSVCPYIPKSRGKSCTTKNEDHFKFPIIILEFDWTKIRN
jgi:hypothetical protein